jgi:hypothetical protein
VEQFVATFGTHRAESKLLNVQLTHIILLFRDSRKTVKDRSHFYATRRGPQHQNRNNQCPLYSNTEEDDEAAMRAAGYAAFEKVKQGHAQGDGTTASPSIDVESLLN